MLKRKHLIYGSTHCGVFFKNHGLKERKGGYMAEIVSFSQEAANPYFSQQNHVVKLKLRKEQLDLFKEKIKTGEVKIHKEVIIKEKTIVVPVNCEVLVIQRKVMNNQEPNNSGQTKTIRIPLSEERIEIVKHPTPLTAVSIYEQQYQKNEHVKRTLKTEKLKIDICGSAKVKDTNE